MNQDDTEAERRKLNELSGKVIGACVEIHRELGPGLLENAYGECLAYELSKTGLRFERQQSLPVCYKEVQLDCGYRLDFVIEGLLIVELKAVTELQPIHEAQLLTYLKLGGKSLGLHVNFNVPTLKQGVKRVACGDLFKEGVKSASPWFPSPLFSLCLRASVVKIEVPSGKKRERQRRSEMS